jgi:hypothetical protein
MSWTQGRTGRRTGQRVLTCEANVRSDFVSDNDNEVTSFFHSQQVTLKHDDSP